MRTVNTRMASGLDELIYELLDVLDEDIAWMSLTLECLDALRAAIIRRDEEFLKDLLDKIKDGEAGYHEVEQRRQAIRRKLAEFCGCGIGEVNLSRLSILAAEKKELIVGKQRQLKELVERLKKEHTLTAMLVRECSKFNTMLLRQIFGRGNETITYNNRGNASWEAQKGLVNLRL